jgi:hypothetical protein
MNHFRPLKSLFYSILISILLNFVSIAPVSAQTSFKFVAFGDTKSDTDVLENLSVQIQSTINPAFTLFAGDLESSGFSTAIEGWKTALNGATNNGLFDKTFVVRGNHDSSNTAGWQNYFNMSQTATRVGANNYSFLSDDLTYSFDYGNSLFIGVDVLGDISAMPSAHIAWLDQRLTDAENRGIKHAFLFFHGPLYAVANHCCPDVPDSLLTVLNRHEIISAVFAGHEHTLTYTHLTSSRITGLTNDIEQFVTGDAGAGPTSATSGRYDNYVNTSPNTGGFVVVEVNGDNYTISIYKGGTTTPQFTSSFTRVGGGTPTPTIVPTAPPQGRIGDINGDGAVNIVDVGLLIDVYGLQSTSNPSADLNHDGVINIIDVGIIIDYYGS